MDQLKVISSGTPDNGSGAKELARATYKLDKPTQPRVIEFRPAAKSGTFPLGGTRMEITKFSPHSFTSIAPGSAPVEWTKVDSEQYFVILAAKHGTPLEGGPAFVMLLKTNDAKPEIDTFGLYYGNYGSVTGPVPAELYQQFMTEPNYVKKLRELNENLHIRSDKLQQMMSGHLQEAQLHK
ncbi:MAG TPA: hypothetical protein VG649_08725 [Candidatus Angelobacter sp.]|jgi:hypothetical protein|nr:hypothetical protein [Candidatus Angelobacter sp.]